MGGSSRLIGGGESESFMAADGSSPVPVSGSVTSSVALLGVLARLSAPSVLGFLSTFFGWRPRTLRALIGVVLEGEAVLRALLTGDALKGAAVLRGEPILRSVGEALLFGELPGIASWCARLYYVAL